MSPSVQSLLDRISSGEVTPANAKDAIARAGGDSLAIIEVVRALSSAGGAVASVAGKTGVVTLDKTDVGLADVDNTSDTNKPISTATQAALDAKANKYLVDVRAYGATGNARKVTDAVLNGTTTVTSATANFTAGDVGKKIWGVEVATGAARLTERTISAVNSSTSITVSGSAPGSYTGIHLVWGTDDTAAIIAAAAAADALTPKGTVYLPRGGYIITDSVFRQTYATGTTTYAVIGDGPEQSVFYPAPSHAKTGDCFLQTDSNALNGRYIGFGWDGSHYNFATNFYIMAPTLNSTVRDVKMINQRGMLAYLYLHTGINFVERCHFEAAGSAGLQITGSALIKNSYSGNHFGNGLMLNSGASLTWIGGTLDECDYRTVYAPTNTIFDAIGALIYVNGSAGGSPAIEAAGGQVRVTNCRIEPFNPAYNARGMLVSSSGLMQISNCSVKGFGTNGHAVDVQSGEALIVNSALTSTGTGHALNIASGATARLTCTKLTGSGAGDGLANAGTCHDGGGNVADSKSGSAPVTTAL